MQLNDTKDQMKAETDRLTTVKKERKERELWKPIEKTIERKFDRPRTVCYK